MPLPRRVRVGPSMFTVEESENIKHMGDSDGQLIPSTRQLLLTPGGDPAFKRESLLHETLHAVLDFIGGVKALGFEDEDEEERVVSLLTGPLLMVLRDNPSLVRCLTESP